jgi:hypothetical protein
VIDHEFLAEAFDPIRQTTLKELCDSIHVGPDALAVCMKEAGVTNKFSKITNEELDRLIKGYREHNPDSGIAYVIGWLRSNGYRIQRQRIRDSAKRVDGLGVVLRKQQRIKRRVYSVKRPNALWHCDGHHKLRRWGIVIHGFIDGYSRKVCSTSFGYLMGKTLTCFRL